MAHNISNHAYMFIISNFANFFSSFTLITYGIMFALHGGLCEKWRSEPYFVLASILPGLSLLGIAGAYYRRPFLLCIYLFILSLLSIFFMIFIIFAFTISLQGDGKDYKFGDYSLWMQKSKRNWDHVKNCLHSHGLCSNYGSDSPQEYGDNPNVTLIQSGCCKPPTECNFVKQSPMEWNKPMTTSANYSNNPDCGAWDNDPNILCFNWDSCKVGLLEDMKGNLITVASIFIFYLGFCSVLFTMGMLIRRETLNLNRVNNLDI